MREPIPLLLAKPILPYETWVPTPSAEQFRAGEMYRIEPSGENVLVVGVLNAKHEGINVARGVGGTSPRMWVMGSVAILHGATAPCGVQTPSGSN